ncbi:MAG: tetratricopeptide repeat protein [Leptospirales bacterium]
MNLKKIVPLPILFGLFTLLSFSSTFAEPSSNSVLEERIEGVKELNKDQIERLEEKIDLYGKFGATILALLGVIGFATIATIIRLDINNRIDKRLKQIFKQEKVEKKIKERIAAAEDEALNNFGDDLDERANEKLTLLDQKIAELDDLKSKANEKLNLLDKKIEELDLKAKENLNSLRTKYITYNDELVKKMEKTYVTELNILKEKTKDLNINEPIPEETRKELEEFSDTLEKAKEKKEYSAWDWHFKGISYYKKEQYQKAVDAFSEAIRLDPDDEDNYLNRGASYYNLDKHNKAIKDYNKAIELKPDYAEAYNNRGAVYDDLKKYDKAVKDYNKAIELKPDYANAYNNRGIAYNNLEEYDKAVKDYDKAIELKPDYADAYNNRGNTYKNLKKYDEAIKDYDKAIKLKPDYENAYFNRAYSYSQLKQHDMAIEDYKKALELDSKDTTSSQNLAEAYFVTGQPEQALDTVQQGWRDELSDDERATFLLLRLMAQQVLGQGRTETEKQFSEILQNEFTITWSFDIIDNWLDTSDIDEAGKTAIRGWAEQFKERRDPN